MHTHIAPDATARSLALFDRFGVAVAVNLSGGTPGAGLEQTLDAAAATAGRIIVFCNLPWSRAEHPRFVEVALRMLDACKASGARGVKIPKSLGLAAPSPRGGLLAVDDPLLDPFFERAGRLGLPVLIHTGDPRAFFAPATPGNERYDELSVHPEWSFADPRFPRWEALLDAFERRVARHPRTTFVGAHFGNAAEDPDRVEAMLARHPNLYIDTAARVPEFGRHRAERMRAFFVRWQDRVLYGTDLGVGMEHLMLGSTGAAPPTDRDVAHFFRAHARYFETRARRIAHPTPIQGRWTVDAVGLPRDVLDKIYHRNAERVLHLPPARLRAARPHE